MSGFLCWIWSVLTNATFWTAAAAVATAAAAIIALHVSREPERAAKRDRRKQIERAGEVVSAILARAAKEIEDAFPLTDRGIPSLEKLKNAVVAIDLASDLLQRISHVWAKLSTAQTLLLMGAQLQLQKTRGMFMILITRTDKAAFDVLTEDWRKLPHELMQLRIALAAIKNPPLDDEQ